jgi:outer membrane lipoprotein carrier protein
MRSPWFVLLAGSLTLAGPALAVENGAPTAAAQPAVKPATPTGAATPNAATVPAPKAGTPAPTAKTAAPAVKPVAVSAPADATPGARPQAAEVVAKLQKVYEQTTAIKARFAQTLSGPTGKRQASGAVSLKKPGKMRWDYEKPDKKLFVADGTTLWVYEPDEDQAFKQSLSSTQLPTQVSFLFGRGKLLQEFDISYLTGATFGEAGDFVLKLVPKVATAQYRHLVFVVSPTTYMVKETVLYDQQGGMNHIVFSALETNPKSGVDDSRFSFTPPATTKIVGPGR